MANRRNQDLAEVYGRRFRAILDAFTRTDGDPWTGPQIAEASEGELTATHVYNLKNSRTNNPGHRRLEVISKIMGFPMALWSLEPEEWEGDPRIDPRARKMPLPSGPALSAMIGSLVDTLPARSTGEHHTNAEIAQMSGGRLSEERVDLMRRGECHDATREELMGLSEAFDVSFSFWERSPEELLSDRDALEGMEAAAHRRETGATATEQSLEDIKLQLSQQHMDILGLISRLSGEEGKNEGSTR